MPFSDVLIIGSGIAALSAAERLSLDKNVIIITKSNIEASNSMLAQGGVAAVVDKSDCVNDHVSDTITAGCFHNNQEAVKLLVQHGSEHMKNLIKLGMPFDRDRTGRLELGQEGAHNRRRILHAGGDATGKELTTFMLNRVKEKVSIVENEMVLDLQIENGKCVGLITATQSGERKIYSARHVILASGGCGSLFQVSSNNPGIIGDGIAMAYRAGAELTDLEFMQFHPTMLFAGGMGHGLISEAVRGEGAFLVTENGRRIMKGVHDLEDLAPRDVVARAIQKERSKGEEVYLNIGNISNFAKRFPTITSICENAGIDLSEGLLPVAPGAHFLMGGVKTNRYGQTTVPGLYAIGEVACTGVHGANRLASNSLLEGIVFANLLADFILAEKNCLQPVPVKGSKYLEYKSNRELYLPTKAEIRKIMTTYVGIERSYEGLMKAKKWIEQYVDKRTLYTKIQCEQVTTEQMTVVNMLTNGWLMITSALLRTESRGGHYRNDYPMEDQAWQGKQIIRQKEEVLILNQGNLVGVK